MFRKIAEKATVLVPILALEAIVRTTTLSAEPKLIYTVEQPRQYYETQGYVSINPSSNINNTKVVLLGENHGHYDDELSAMLFHYVTFKDSVLLEGLGKGDNLLNYSELQIDASTRNITAAIRGRVPILGCDDIILRDKLEKYGNEYKDMVKDLGKLETKKSLTPGELQEIVTLKLTLSRYSQQMNIWQREREKTYFSAITEAIKRTQGKVYVILGNMHIREGILPKMLEKNNISYVGLLPGKAKE